MMLWSHSQRCTCVPSLYLSTLAELKKTAVEKLRVYAPTEYSRDRCAAEDVVN